MSAYFECNTLPGMAKWMRVQAAEEETHALKFFDYVHDRGGRVLMIRPSLGQARQSSGLDVRCDT